MKHRLTSVPTLLVPIVLFALAGLSGPRAAGPPHGADPDDPGWLISVSNPSGSAVAQNLFPAKLPVYLRATSLAIRPVDALPDGDYIFQVSDPQGTVQLSSDRALCRIFRVEAGVIEVLRDPTLAGLVDHATGTDVCHTDDDPDGAAGASARHDSNPIGDGGGTAVQLMPFADTPDADDYYRVSVLPLKLYLDNGGWIFRLPKPFGEGYVQDPGFKKAKQVLFDDFRIGANDGTNHPPVADAGSDQSFLLGETISLDGSGSSDPDGDPLNYAWTLNGPAGSAATLDDSTAVMPTFVPDLRGEYTATLIVDDGTLDSAPDSVTIRTANSPPVADAGPDRTTFPGIPVVLDGSGSGDVDGDFLTFAWSIVSPAGGGDAALDDPQAESPSLIAQETGTYVVELVVSDGMFDSAADAVTVQVALSENFAPVADAGPDQTFLPGETIALDGSGSSDLDGDPLTFAWTLATVPAGSLADLNDPTFAMPTFVADLAGTYTARLIVNDGQLDSDPDEVSIRTGNSPPVADAGPDRTMAVPGTVVLDGSGSSDIDGDPLTYLWSFVTDVDPAFFDIDEATDPMPFVFIGIAGTYELQLVVSDGEFESEPDRMVISFENQPPVANAGPDRAALPGEFVILDGSGSFDPNGTPITYSWSLTTPESSLAILSDATAPMPTFQVDLHGEYLAQLIVHDGELSSAPDTAVVTTVNTPPVADAGPDATVLPGASIALDGSGSSDADGDPLTYSWSLSSAPQGSDAALSDPTAMMPTLSTDLPGSYVVQLIVHDGTSASAPDTAIFSTENIAPVADAGSDRSVLAGVQVFVDGTGSSDADGDPLSYRWTFASRPSGSLASFTDSTAAQADFFADRAGIYVVQLVVNDGSLDSPADTAVVTAQASLALGLSFESNFIGIDRTVSGTVFSQTVAPAGGIPVTLSSDDGTIAAISPLSVTIPEGQFEAPVSVDGIALGEAVLRADAPGYVPAAQAVTVTDFLVSVSEQLELAPGETAGLPVSLSSPAPNGGQTVFFTSDDPQIATVTPSVFVPEGSQTPQANPQVVGGDIGQVTIRAISPGYAPDTAEVTVTLEMFFSPNSVALPLETKDFVLTFLSPTPPQGLVLNLSIDDPAIAGVPATLQVPGGVLSFPIPVTGLSDGDTVLRAQASGVSEAVGNVRVRSILTLDPREIGENLQQGVQVSLGVSAPLSGRTIVVTSSDPSKLLLALSSDELGSASVSLTIPAGGSGGLVWLQALTGDGQVDVTASAPAHQLKTTSMTLLRSGFAFVPSSVQTNTQAGEVPVAIGPHVLHATSSHPFSVQRLRPGVDVLVEVTSSDSGVATLSDVPVQFLGGNGAQSMTLHPLSGGATTLTLQQPPGFGTPSTRTEIVATVTTPPLQFGGLSSGRVGYQLLETNSIGFTVLAQDPVPVTLTVADPSILTIGPVEPETPGSGSWVIPPTVNGGSFLLHGLAIGSTTITAEAPGFLPATSTFEVIPSGFAFRQLASQTQLTTLSPNFPAEVVAVTSTFGTQIRQLRPGATASVEISNSNPAVAAVIGAPALFDGPASRVPIEVDALAGGQTVLELVQPAGFTYVTGLADVTVTVNEPTLALSSTSAVLDPIRQGLDTQRLFSAGLGLAPPSPVDLTVTIADPSIATLTVDLAADSSAGSILFPSLTTSGASSQFGIQAKSIGTTSLTLAAPGYQTRVVGFEATPSGFVLNYNTNVPINTFDENRIVRVFAAGLDPVSLASYGVQELRPGVSAEVEVISSNPSVAAITASPVLVTSGAGFFQTELDPLTAGTTQLSTAAPPGFTHANEPPVTVTVEAPTISFGVVPAIGLDMQWGLSVVLSERPPNPIDVTVFTTSPEIFAVSPGATIVGGNSVTFTNVTQFSAGVIFVQGLSLGSAQITAQAPGYADESRTIHVYPSGFVHDPPIEFNLFGGVGSSRVASVEPVVLHPTNLSVLDDRAQIRAGITVEVTMTSGDEGIVTVAPVTAQGGSSQLSFTVNAVGTGTTTLTVDAPPGFSQPANETVMNAIVP